jgi:hypothetical protein
MVLLFLFATPWSETGIVLQASSWRSIASPERLIHEAAATARATVLLGCRWAKDGNLTEKDRRSLSYSAIRKAHLAETPGGLLERRRQVVPSARLRVRVNSKALSNC